MSLRALTPALLRGLQWTVVQDHFKVLKQALRAFESGPGDFCLGLAVEQDKAKSSPRSSSLRESSEIEEEEAK